MTAELATIFVPHDFDKMSNLAPCGVNQIAYSLQSWCDDPGSVLINQSQKITVAAIQMAKKNVWAHLS